MNYWFAGGLIAVAVAATGLALWAGPNLAISAVAAAAAVVAAGLLFLSAWVDRPPARVAVAPYRSERDIPPFRYGFRSGRFGREELISTLDRIERLGPTPELKSRSSGEMDSIARLSAAEFSDYVRRRLDDLEART
ncbi:MAG: hypothetical protein L3J68_02540 [Thermoplasmata archaeon]|nr:hypothetical protein [Thermoplasmata archaeon]